MSALWNNTIQLAQTLRHDLHAQPELSWQEEQTAERIRNLLTQWQIPWRSCAGTGTLAQLNPGGAGKHLALRADIDALPITENTNKPYQSLNPGCMHACGHDGHTATLLATAHWLKQRELQLPGPLTLLFQPAEEGGHGAKKMIEDGALEGIDEIYGWHNWPAIPFGQMACPDGIVMCGNGVFSIRVKGQGGHASQPEHCKDPVLAAATIVTGLQQIISRRLPPQQAAVVSVTSIDAPSAPTVIPEVATIGGSIRIPDEFTRDKINHLIEHVSKQIAAGYGVDCDVTVEPRYQATINHASQARNMRQLWQQEWGDQGLTDASIALPVMASEDFSYYLKEIPGAFALIGADDGEDHHFPCHSTHYDFNDRLIERVAKLYCALAGLPVDDAPST